MSVALDLALYAEGAAQVGVVWAAVAARKRQLARQDKSKRLPQQFFRATIVFQEKPDTIRWVETFSGDLNNYASHEEAYEAAMEKCVKLKNDEGRYIDWKWVCTSYTVVENKPR